MNPVPALVGISPGVRVLVAGGTGVVGSGVVQALLKQGAKVIVATRCMDRYSLLHKETNDDLRENLSGIEGDVSTEEGVKKIFECVTVGPDRGVKHVVTSVGSWWQKGRMVDQPLTELHGVFKDYVTGPFLLFTLFAPYINALKGGGTFTMVTCAAADEYQARNTSLMTVGCSAVLGLSLAARAEYAHSKLAVSQVHVKCRVTHMADSMMSQDDPYNVGNDLIGAAIAASVGSRLHDRITIRHRDDAQRICSHKEKLN